MTAERKWVCGTSLVAAKRPQNPLPGANVLNHLLTIRAGSSTGETPSRHHPRCPGWQGQCRVRRSGRFEVRRERDGDGSNDSFTVRLKYLTGFSVTLGSNLLSSLAKPRFHLRGTRGNFWKWGLDPQEDALGTLARIGDGEWGSEPSSSWGTLSVDEDGGMITKPVPSESGDYRRFYAGVREALLGNPSKELATPTDAWRGARILEWAKQSSDEHRDVECDWSGEPA